MGTRVVRRFLLSPAEESLVALRFCLVRPPRPVDSSMVVGWRRMLACGWTKLVVGGVGCWVCVLVCVADLWLLLSFPLPKCTWYKMIFSHPFARNLGAISLCLEARSLTPHRTSKRPAQSSNKQHTTPAYKHHGVRISPPTSMPCCISTFI